MNIEPENPDDPIESLKKLIERRKRQEKEEQLKTYLSNLGVKSSSFPTIFLN